MSSSIGAGTVGSASIWKHASTFAVAKHFDARRAAALILIDDLVGEKNSLAEVSTTQSLGPLMREREEQVLPRRD